MSTEDKEDLSEYKGNEGLAQRWCKELEIVLKSKEQESFETIGDKIVKIYKNSTAMEVVTGQSQLNNIQKSVFNILWSNVQVMKPTLFARMPKVVVQRRTEDPDPVARLACSIGERCVSYSLDCESSRFYNAVRAAIEDRLLPGRGVGWERYEVELEPQTDPNTGEPLVDENNEPIMVPKQYSQKAVTDYVYWKDFFHSPGRSPQDWRWVARRVYMTRSELRQRFGEVANLVNLDHEPEEVSKYEMTGQEKDFFKKAKVYEIWDKDSKQRIWITMGLKNQPLDVQPDQLKLEGFFPCPCPLYATLTTDSCYPTPDYKIYEKLAQSLEETTQRIMAVADCIRVVGACQGSLEKDLKGIMKLDDGDLRSITQWIEFAERGGFKGAVDWFPFDKAAEALQSLLNLHQFYESKIFEINGIPDIVRGSSNPSETAAAQQMKGRWTTIKIAEKQQDVQSFVKELLAKKFEIIFEPGLFPDELIYEMANVGQMSPEDQQLFPQAMQLLRDDRLRTFRVDIETDSTIAIDEEQDKASAMELMQATGSLFSQAAGLIQIRPEFTKPALETALLSARAFRRGRSLEGAYERAVQEIEQNDAAARDAAQQPPPPDPEQMKMQADAQYQQFKAELDMRDQQLKEQKAMSDQQLKEYQAQAKVMLEQYKADADLQLKSKELDHKMVMQQREMAIAAMQERLKMAEEAMREPMAQSQGMIDELKAKVEKAMQPQIFLTLPGGGSKEVVLDDGMGGVRRGVVRDLQ